MTTVLLVVRPGAVFAETIEQRFIGWRAHNEVSLLQSLRRRTPPKSTILGQRDNALAEVGATTGIVATAPGSPAPNRQVRPCVLDAPAGDEDRSRDRAAAT